MITLLPPAIYGWPLALKRFLDVTIAAVLLVLLLPLMLILALVVKLTSPGPVFFVQTRVGLNKRRFSLLKFRTMVVNAEEEVKNLEALNEASGPVFKIEDDPRLEPGEKDRFHTAFLQAVETGSGDDRFARELHPVLAPGTPAAEVQLIRESPAVLRVTRSLDPQQRSAMLRCVSIMSSGMGEFERSRSRSGLTDVSGLERYCYFVAGVVGSYRYTHDPLSGGFRGE